jgi:hypothetical protein
MFSRLVYVLPPTSMNKYVYKELHNIHRTKPVGRAQPERRKTTVCILQQYLKYVTMARSRSQLWRDHAAVVRRTYMYIKTD